MKNKRILVAILLSVAVLLIGGIFAFNAIFSGNTADFNEITITTTKYLPKGVCPDSSFNVFYTGKLGKNTLKKYLSVTPEFSYDIEENEDGGLLIKPKNNLELDTSYKFTLSNPKSGEKREFLFNTITSEITVTGVYPGNGVNDVPTSTRIEIDFSAPMEEINDYFEITPPVDGKFIYKDTKVFFEPMDKDDRKYFDSNTTYTFSIKKGLKGKYAGELQEDMSFSFTTGEGYETSELQLSSGYYWSENPMFETFLPDEEPVFEIRNNAYVGKGYSEFPEEYAENFKEVHFDINVYALGSPTDYEYYLHYYSDYSNLRENLKVDTKDLKKVLSFDTTVNFENSKFEEWGFAPIAFPQTLEKGWYVMDCTAKRPDGSTILLQKFLQISPITYYQQSANEEILLWFNDGITGEPVANKNVVITKKYLENDENITTVTDKNGIARVAVPIEDKRPDPYMDTYYCVKNGEDILYADFNNGTEYDNLRYDYYNYLYYDKSLYKKSDTIRFWGSIIPRQDDVKKPEKVRAKLFGSGTSSPLFEHEMDIDEYGSFEGSFTYEDLAQGYYYIIFGIDDRKDGLNMSKSFTVADYKLPDYVHTAKSDKTFYMPTDKIKADFNIKFYDGTPMSDTPVCFSITNNYGKDSMDGVHFEPVKMNTDNDGSVSVEVAASQCLSGGITSWWPKTQTLYFYNERVEDSELNANLEVHIFPYDTMVTTDLKFDDEKTTLEINTNLIDPTNLKYDDMYNLYGQKLTDKIKGRGVPKDVEIKIRRSYQKKTYRDTYFDPYTKQNVENYDYEYVEEEYKTIDSKTNEEGKLIITDLPKSSRSENFIAEIIVDMGDDNVIIEDVSLADYEWYGKGYYRDYGVGKRYSAEVSTKYASNNIESIYSSGYFNANDEMTVELLENDEKFELPEKGRIMYNLAQTNIEEVKVSHQNTVKMSIDKKYIPNFRIYGAYFDGRRIYPIKPRSMLYNKEERELNIEVTPSKESFMPGEEMEVSLKVTDNEGKGKANTKVTVSVVNEALFDLMENKPDLLNEFYDYVYYYYPQISSSYRQRGENFNYDEGGKGGGGGPDGLYIRDNFEDSVDMVSVVTDRKGNAAVKIKLPDSLTSWRITALALSKDLYVGDNKENTVTTLPFFVKPIISSEYLTADEVGFTLRGFGSKVGKDDKIKYTVTVDDTKAAEAEGAANEYIGVNLGKFTAGEHSAVIVGECGEYKDAAQVKFNVMETAMETRIIETFNLKDGLTVDTDKTPINILLYNEDYDTFVKAADIIRFAFNGREDEILSRKLIGKTLENYYGKDIKWGKEYTSGIDRQNNVDGKGSPIAGIKIFPYSEPSMTELSRLAVVAPEYVTSNEMYTYENLLRDYVSVGEDGEIIYLTAGYNHSDIAGVILGISALGGKIYEYEYQQYMTGIIDGYLSNIAFTERDKINLISAYSYFDKSMANQFYDSIVTPLIQKDGDKFSLKGGENYNSVDITATALMCAQLIGRKDDAEGFVRYIYENQFDRYTHGECALELAMYVRNFTPKRLSAPVVRYTLRGETFEKSLDKGESAYLSLTNEEFKALNLQLVSGDAMGRIDYTGAPKYNSLEKAEYMTVNFEKVTLKEGVGGTEKLTYNVHFNKEAPEGFYELSLWIPSNMRVRKFTLPYDFPYSLDNNDHLVKFYIYRYDRADDIFNNFQISFEAQRISDAEASFDAVYLMNMDTGECYTYEY